MSSGIRIQSAILAVSVVLVLTSACCVQAKTIKGSGDLATEERDVSDFNQVAISNQGDLIITVGDEEKLVIEAEDNLLEYIETKVHGRRLKIGTVRGNYNIKNRKPIRYHLTVKELVSVETSSVGSIKVPELEVDEFSVRASSCGDVEIGALKANYLEVRLSSTGSLTIKDGKVPEQSIRISSTGSYDGEGVECERARARLSSTGKAIIQVSDRLDAKLSSTGSLYYIGDPEVHARVSSVGRIKKMD